MTSTLTSLHRQLFDLPKSTAELPELDGNAPAWPIFQVPTADALLAVRRTPGPGNDAGLAVYVHGLGGSSSNWTDLAGQLSCRVRGLAVDLPGFGGSVPVPGRAITPRSQADAVIGLIEAESPGNAVELFGNSMGGLVSAIVAARRPELVRSLTLISPAVPDLRPDPHRMSDPRLALAMLPVIGNPVRRRLAELSAEQRTQQMLELCFARPELVSAARRAEAIEETCERMRQPWASAALSSATLGLLGAWMRLGPRSVWHLLRAINAPTLVVWGTEDKLVTVAKAVRTARAIPAARLLVLPDTGHVAQMEEPVAVARAALGMWESAMRGQW
ncbi:MAG: alpha/beta fold hydrolase [Sciscionella sp.]